MSKVFEEMMAELEELEKLPEPERSIRAYASLPEDDPIVCDIFEIGNALCGQNCDSIT